MLLVPELAADKRGTPGATLATRRVATELDGAGCFAGGENRNCSRFVKIWSAESGAIVEQVSQSFGEAQMNKTALDTHFSYLTKVRHRSVAFGGQAGDVADDALSNVDAFQRSDLSASSFSAFWPDRTNQPRFENNVDYGAARCVWCVWCICLWSAMFYLRCAAVASQKVGLTVFV